MESFTFWNVFLLEFLGISVVCIIFLLATMVFDYLQLVELKLGASILLVTVAVAIASSQLWEISTWLAIGYAISTMLSVLALLAILWSTINALIGLVRNRN